MPVESESYRAGYARTGLPPDINDVVLQLHSSAVHLKCVPTDTLAALSTVYPDLVPADSFQGALSEDSTFDIGYLANAKVNQRQLLGQLERFVDESTFKQLSDYVMLHAGVVAAGKQSILFPASSGAGKSTLVAALSLSGFRYLSDEFAVLSRSAPSVHAYSKSICLKADGWRLIQEAYGVSSELVDVHRGDGQVVYFFPAPQRWTEEQAAEVRYVLIPARRDHGPARLGPISRTETLSTIMQQSLNLPWHGARGLDALVRLVEAAQCFRLTYSDLHDAVNTVINMVAGASDVRLHSRTGESPYLEGHTG